MTRLWILLVSILAAGNSFAGQIEDVYRPKGCEKGKECRGIVVSVRKVNVIKVVLQDNTSRVLRLAGIIPSEDEKIALEGKEFLKRYLNMGQVYPTVKIEEENIESETEEIPAYVFYQNTLVNGEIIKRGFGRYDDKTDKYKELLKQMEDKAKETKIGIFK